MLTNFHVFKVRGDGEPRNLFNDETFPIYGTSSSSSSFENTNLTNHSSNELETLYVSRFPSDLVHRHIIFLLTLLLLEKMMIISPDNTAYVKTGKPCEQWTWKLDFLLESIIVNPLISYKTDIIISHYIHVLHNIMQEQK